MTEETKKYSTDPGPIKERKVKDIPFCVLFVLVWIAMFVVSGLAITKGDVKRLKYGRDYLGNLCGSKTSLTLESKQYDFDFTEKKYLYFVNLGFEEDTTPICVKSCPQFDSKIKIADSIDEQYKKMPVKYAVNSTLPDPYYEAKSTAFRCIPSSSFKYNTTQFKPLFGKSSDDASKDASDKVTEDADSNGRIAEIWNTLESSVGYIALSLLIGTGFSVLYLITIQFFGRFMVWFTLVFANVAFFALGAFFFGNYARTSAGKPVGYGNKKMASAAQNENIMLACGVVCMAIAVGLLTITLFLRKRIVMAIDLIHQASIAMRSMPTLLLMPIIKYIILVAVFAWSLFIMALLASSGDVIVGAVQGNSKKMASYSPNQVLNYLQIFYLFGTFWTFNFIIAIMECITAGAIAQWYWTLDRKNLPGDAVWSSVKRTFKYHLGSLAFGSMIIALLQTLRAILSFVQVQAKKAKNPWIKRILQCFSCCLYCFEKTLKFLNTNAYIEIAIYGYSFCEGAREAFQLLWRNALKAMVVNGVGEFVMFLGKALITAATTFITFALLNRSNDDDSADDSNKGLFMMPLLFVALGTYFIASLFTAVLKLSIQTVFLSLLEDGERHDGSAAKPYYAPEELKPFLENHKSAQGMTEK